MEQRDVTNSATSTSILVFHLTMDIYDTWERRVRPFIPRQKGHVGLYCCGPTVYNFAHIGNLRTYVFEDLLRRTLQFEGMAVTHIVNITDVGHLTSDADSGEDKMDLASRRTGDSAWEIAARYTLAFQEDWRSLNLLEPTRWCRATEHIPEQIEFIEDLAAKGYTYKTEDGLYFATALQHDYGFLSRLTPEKLRAGTRVELGDKRSVTDFALWRRSPIGGRRQMEWQSPWGLGCPGWHIECSAMAVKYLGELFDIHCGGEDHIAVHHSNEIAQTEARFGTRLANYWMHAAFLQVDEKKMAKSSGEFLTLASLVRLGYDPLAYRYLCLSAHYRGPLNFTLEALDAAASGLERLRHAFQGAKEDGKPDADAVADFRTAICNDLNMPQALAIAWTVARSTVPAPVRRATLALFDDVLGLQLAAAPERVHVPNAVQSMLEQREMARMARDWSRADALRNEILAAGYDVADSPDGVVLRRRSPAR
jgi:cysteinyl-tRNA synthetase